MYNNDHHRKVLDFDQQYNALRFSLDGEMKPHSFLELDWVVLWKGKDRESPAVPTGFTIVKAKNQIQLRWNGSRDNLMTAFYEIAKKEGNVFKRVTIATVNYFDVSAGKLTPGKYAVRAVDAAGNTSAYSNTTPIK